MSRQLGSLAAARPEDILRCGVILGEAAEQIRSAVTLSRRSSQVTWFGPTGTAYQHRLGRLTGKLDRAGSAFGEAGDVLIAYSRALAEAKELAGRAEALAQSAELAALNTLHVGPLGLPDPVAALQAGLVQRKAGLLFAQAEAVEADAARRAALTLHALAGEAPHERAGTAVSRIGDDIGTSLAAQVDGVVGIGRSLWHSLPGVGRDDQRALGRHQALQAAKQMVQPWLAVEQLLDNLHDGRPGLAAGTVLGAALTKKVAPLGESAVPLFKGHQFAPKFLRGLPDGALMIREHAEAWAQAHEAKAFQDSIAQLRAQAAIDGRSAVPPDWLDRPLDLRQHEASGGHLLLKHVDARIELLQWRLRLEASGNYRSTFHGVAQAEQLVASCLKQREAAVLNFVRSGRLGQSFSINLEGRYGTVLSRDGQVATGGRLRVMLMRHNDGSVYIFTAMIDP